MLRTGRPLRPFWRLAHAAVISASAAFLLRGNPGSGAYLRASFGYGDEVYGLSDVDMAVVLADSGPGEHACPRVRRRWARLCRMVPGLWHLVQPTVYERGELLTAVSATSLTTEDAVHLAPGLPCDPAGLRMRPGLFGAMGDWRHVAGGDVVDIATRSQDPDQRRIAAWLELQRWWREAMFACAHPGGPRLPYLCVKLVAEPARIWLWLVHGEKVERRRDVLERALRLLPDEEEAITAALRLHHALPRSPEAPLAEMLPAFVRLSARLADRLEHELADVGATEVRLDWGGEEELVLGPGARDRLLGLTGEAPRLLPLADWRARVWPVFPDHALAPAALDPADPAALGAAALAAGDWGPYAALRRDGLLVLPGPGLMRAVQTPASDPVSFALLNGAAGARFRDVPGWSAADSARRAVAEHRAWLGARRPGAESALSEWNEAQARTTLPTAASIATLLTAVQAAFFHSSLIAGEPELPLTLAASARRLAEVDPGAAALADEALGHLRAERLGEGQVPAPVVGALREAVLRLPEYAFDSPWEPRRGVAGTMRPC
jgi:hypothetical protein